ncbi:MAG TPA: hypothetical protein VHB98_12095, partial [Chloroflexota bacterium]|nr:hypothetical protein [Chloroflexota bacterium]
LLEGDTGALEWVWSEVDRASGRSVTMEDAIVFTLRDGQIVYWREYFDTAPLQQPAAQVDAGAINAPR